MRIKVIMDILYSLLIFLCISNIDANAELVDWIFINENGQDIKVKATIEYKYPYKDKNKAPIIEKDKMCLNSNYKREEPNSIECILAYLPSFYENRKEDEDISWDLTIRDYKSVSFFRIIGKYKYRYDSKDYIELHLYNEKMVQDKAYTAIFKHIKDNKYILIGNEVEGGCYSNCDNFGDYGLTTED
jgi:hypothetical protein